MLSIARLRPFPKHIVPLRRSIYTNRPMLDAETRFQKLKLKQAQFQCDDDVPVYLKRGTRDKVVFYFTVGFAIFNFFLNMKQLKPLCKKFTCVL